MVVIVVAPDMSELDGTDWLFLFLGLTLGSLVMICTCLRHDKAKAAGTTLGVWQNMHFLAALPLYFAIAATACDYFKHYGLPKALTFGIKVRGFAGRCDDIERSMDISCVLNRCWELLGRIVTGNGEWTWHELEVWVYALLILYGMLAFVFVVFLLMALKMEADDKKAMKEKRLQHDCERLVGPHQDVGEKAAV